MGKPIFDKVGKTYGNLTVIARIPSIRPMWRCRCECGREKPVRSDLLEQGKVKSCGCLTRKLSGTTHKAYRLSEEEITRRGIQPRRCTRCKKLKQPERFRNAMVHVCKDCGAARRKLHSRSDPAPYLRQRFKTIYGLTPEEYQGMVQAKDGKCEICGQPHRGKQQRLSVDHNHETHFIRGLLCGSCNCLLGYAGDSVELLEKAIEYLKWHASNPSDRMVPKTNPFRRGKLAPPSATAKT